MTWLALYLLVGVANAVQFVVKQRRYTAQTMGDHPGNWHQYRVFSSVPEAVLFVVAWPLQLLYFVAMHLANGVEWAYRKFAGE